jgi:hypothetical protein
VASALEEFSTSDPNVQFSTNVVTMMMMHLSTLAVFVRLVDVVYKQEKENIGKDMKEFFNLSLKDLSFSFSFVTFR